ncbi:MAG: hypothetical protein A2Z25_00440 [Planctomycetes bacterium RBG_16_55_9]|nr:MAG: hypothetical protein A2Z25_00440 [Planctomycetes bacterium RBG_16_55_9]
MKTYKRWTIITLLIFLGLMVLLVLTDLGLTVSLPLDEAVFNKEFEEKVRTFLLSEDGKAVDVILCGDSRAERQLIPDVVKDRTGLNAVNIATKGLDLVTLANGFKKYSILQNTDAFIVISTSIFQINDGAVGDGYTTPACIFNLKWTSQIKLFKKYLPYLIDKKMEYYWDYFKSHAESAKSRKKEFLEKGYLAITETIELSDGQLKGDINKITHPWYKDFTFPGRKWEIFQRALRDIASSGNPIIIFNPPGCPAWLELTQNTFMDAAERQFSAFLKQEAQKYDNVFFLDFYSENRKSFTNGMFYNLQHLNRKGADVFSRMISQDISELLKTRKNDVKAQEVFSAPRN